MKLLLPLVVLGVLVICCQAQDPLKEKVLCIIETQLSSSSCKNSARLQADAENDPATACATLEALRVLLEIVHCTSADYDLLHSVVCEQKDIPCSLPA